MLFRSQADGRLCPTPPGRRRDRKAQSAQRGSRRLRLSVRRRTRRRPSARPHARSSSARPPPSPAGLAVFCQVVLNKGDDDIAQASINIRMDEDLKKQFDAFCSDVGMSMTTAFCVFAKTAVRERRIPFEISPRNDPFYSSTNTTRLRRSIAQMATTGGTVHEVPSDD